MLYVNVSASASASMPTVHQQLTPLFFEQKAVWQRPAAPQKHYPPSITYACAGYGWLPYVALAWPYIRLTLCKWMLNAALFSRGAIVESETGFLCHNQLNERVIQFTFCKFNSDGEKSGK